MAVAQSCDSHLWKNWSHPIHFCEWNVSVRAVRNVSCQFQVGNEIWQQWIQLSMLSQMILVMTLGVFLVLNCWPKVCIDSFLWLLLSLPGHCRIWLVSSQSCWHLKHLLLFYCQRFAVSLLLVVSHSYFEIWMRCPMLSCLKFSPIGRHAMLS